MTATGILSAPDAPDAHASTLPSGPVAESRRSEAHRGFGTPAPPGASAAASDTARIAAVAFDVGETLIDESRIWTRWADRLGVTPLTMLGVLGAMAALDRPHMDAFHVLRPGIDIEAELSRWRADDPDGLRENFDADDLYGDVRTCFAALRAARRKVIVAGNQPPQAQATLEAMDLGADAILISANLGAEKPASEFFAAVVAAAGCAPGEIVYVGDRLDNDVLPARRAGMRTALLRRGPWGHLHAERPDAALADVVVDSLAELPDVLVSLKELARGER
jgi:HAD superfamily hydrolase (TIGR01549 family)